MASGCSVSGKTTVCRRATTGSSLGYVRTLSGVVRDSQGGILPGVSVTVSSAALIGGTRTVATGELGTYQFMLLPPGTYEVKYELSGFAALKREDIRVLVAQTTRLDVELGV